jgi:hypothetical protein
MRMNIFANIGIDGIKLQVTKKINTFKGWISILKLSIAKIHRWATFQTILEHVWNCIGGIT